MLSSDAKNLEFWTVQEVPDGEADQFFVIGKQPAQLGSSGKGDIYTGPNKAKNEIWSLVDCAKADAGGALKDGEEYFAIDNWDKMLGVKNDALRASKRKSKREKWKLELKGNDTITLRFQRDSLMRNVAAPARRH